MNLLRWAILQWRRWQRWRAESNRAAAGVLLSPARRAYEEQLEREKQLGQREPVQQTQPGSRAYWREQHMGGEKS